MDSCLALQILSKHLTLEVDFLQAVLKVHYTLKRTRERQEERWKSTTIKAVIIVKLSYIKKEQNSKKV